MSSQKIFSPLQLLLPYQKAIFNDKSKYQVLLCSRQVGKSFLCAAKSVVHCLTHPNSLVACVSVNLRSSSELLAKCEMWSEAYYLVGKTLGQDFSYKASFDKVEFANGSRILALPGNNPASLRGFTGSIVLDEFALVQNDEDIWAAIAPIITNQLTGKDKFIFVCSTPTSKNTRFAKIWYDDTDKWSKHSLTIYQAVEQGLKANTEELKSLINDDLIWRTEYLCEFASDAYDAFDIDKIKVFTDLPKEAKIKYMGFDVARSRDFSAIATIADAGQKKYLLDVKTMKNVPFAMQLDTVKELNNKQKWSSGFIDSCGMGAMMAESCTSVNGRLKGLTWTGSNKTPLHNNLRQVIANEDFYVHKDIIDLVKNDMSNMRRVVSANGNVSYSAPHTKDGHSDITSSIVLALAAAHDMPASFSEPQVHSNYSSFGRRPGIFCRY